MVIKTIYGISKYAIYRNRMLLNKLYLIRDILCYIRSHQPNGLSLLSFYFYLIDRRTSLSRVVIDYL